MHAGVFGAVVVLARVFLVPVENAAHEGRDERDAGLGRRNGLVQAEEQREVAVDAFLLKDFSGADAFPGRGDLDEDAVAANAGVVVLLNDGAALSDGGLGVVGEAGIDFGGDAAGNDGQDLLAEGDGQAFEGQVGHVFIGCAFAQLLARVEKYAVDNGLVLRHLRGGGDQRGVGGGVLGAELFHRLDVACVGDDHGVLAQLFE